MNNELMLYGQDDTTRAQRVAGMPEGDLRRVAVEAVTSRRVELIWPLVESYLLTHGKVSKHTLSNRKQALKPFLAWAVSRGVNLLRPGRNDGELYMRSLEADGYKPLTIRSRLAGVRAFYKALRWAGATEADPFENTKAPQDNTPAWEKRDAYDEAEVEAMLAEAGVEDRALILLYAHGGLRASEALALCWRDIDFKRGFLTVVEGKGGKTARVNMSATLVKALVTLLRYREGVIDPAPDGWGEHEAIRVRLSESVRQGNPKPRLFTVSRQLAWRRLARVAKHAGVEFKGLHSFRHYAGTRLAIQTGGNLEAVAGHLRHSKLETARVYAKRGDQRVRAAVAGW